MSFTAHDPSTHQYIQPQRRVHISHIYYRELLVLVIQMCVFYKWSHWVPDLPPRVKAAGAWRWPLIPSSAEVKEGVEVYVCSPSGPSWPVLGWPLPLPLTFKSFPFNASAFSSYRIVLCNARTRTDWQGISKALRVDAKAPRSGPKEGQEARRGEKERNELKRK
jgi:hypothetical protein